MPELTSNVRTRNRLVPSRGPEPIEPAVQRPTGLGKSGGHATRLVTIDVLMTWQPFSSERAMVDESRLMDSAEIAIAVNRMATSPLRGLHPTPRQLAACRWRCRESSNFLEASARVTT